MSGTIVGFMGSQSTDIKNIALTATASGGFVISLVTHSGAALSATKNASISFRSATATLGTYVSRVVAAPVSLTIPSGASLGGNGTDSMKVCVFAIDDAGTVKLGVVQGGFLDEGLLHTTALLSNVSTSAVVLYAASVLTNKAVRFLGYVDVIPGAGLDWGNEPTAVSCYLPNGGISEQVVMDTFAQTLTNKTIVATDNTISALADGNIASDAAIARTKIASGTAYRVLANTSTGVVGENAALTPDYAVVVDANGQLTGEQYLAKTKGGTGISSAATFPASGTVTTNDSAVVLENKLIDGSCALVDTTDNTKTLKTNLAAQSTGVDITLTTGAETADRTLSIPVLGGNRTLVMTDLAQVISDKDIDGGTAGNTNRLTVPKNTKANLDLLVRKEGTIVYGTDTDTMYADDGTTLLALTSGDSVVPATKGGTGIVNDVAATLTRAGAHSLTLTTSNTTDVTLPVSGTLSTLAGAEVLENKLLESSCKIVDLTDNTKTLRADLSNLSTGVDLILTAGAETADRVVNIPVLGADRTLVMTDLAQVLAAKDLDSTCKIVDATNNTKTIKFNVAAQSAGVDITLTTSAETADRVLTLPVLGGPQTLVMEALAQTLTNKTIDSASNTITNIDNGDISATAAIVRTKMADGTAYRVLANNSTGVMSENAALTAAYPVITDANGQLATEQYLATTRGGTGTTSTATFPSSGVVTTDADASVLENKTLEATCKLVDTTDNTKTLKWNLAAQATGVDLTVVSGVETADRNINIPVLGADRTLVMTDLAQVITAKDIDGGTAADTSRITAPKNTKTNLDGLTRKEGTVVYGSDTKKLYVDDGSSLKAVGASGSGSGETNYVTNPSGSEDNAAAVPVGWANVGDLDIVVSKTAAELPRENITKSGLKITADANAQTTADYVYYDFSLDDVDMAGQPLKIKWDQKMTGTYLAGELAVVITTQADRTTAVSTPFTSAIPASDGTFQTYFLAPATATCSLVIRCTGEMATDGGIVISDVVVGPNVQVQGSAIGAWKAFTPAYTNGGTGTTAGYYREEGDSVRIRVQTAWTGAGAAASLAIKVPNSYTIDSTKTGIASSRDIMGAATWYDASGGSKNLVPYAASTTLIQFVVTGTVTILNGNDLANTDELGVDILVPVNELSSNVTLANRAVEEYAFNTTTTDADDTTAFGYGPAGGVIPTVASSATGTSRAKRVRFVNPIQSTDSLIIEVQLSGTGIWRQLSQTTAYQPYGRQGATAYGIGYSNVSSTDIDVLFARGGRQADGSTYASAGSAMPSDAADRWRIRKVSGGASVGYPISSANIVGRTDGVAPAAGMVGETIEAAASVGATGSESAAIATITLTTGYWSVSAGVRLASTGAGQVVCKLFKKGATPTVYGHELMDPAFSTYMTTTFPVQPVNVASGDANKTVYLTFTGVGGAATANCYAYISAVRIA